MTKTQEKARKSFDYACRQASTCRHSKCIISCYNCPDQKDCDIQRRVDKARQSMKD